MAWHSYADASALLKASIDRITPPQPGAPRLKYDVITLLTKDGHYLLVFYDNDPKPLAWCIIPLPGVDF